MLIVLHIMDEFRDLAIGIFDGFHHGHLSILQKLKSNPSVLTFHPHPRENVKLIFDIQNRIKILNALGIADVFVYAKTDGIYELDANLFIKNILIPKNVKNVFVGADFRLGKDRGSSALEFKELARKFSINVNIVEPTIFNGIKLSSSNIREELKNGNIFKTNKLLTYKYFYTGIVQHGTRTAEKLGYKTANLIPPSYLLIPNDGVYKTTCIYDGLEYKAITYIGKSPTLLNNSLSIIETHIFDFNKVIYNESITVIFVDKIRGEMKFKSKDELLAQINHDLSYARN